MDFLPAFWYYLNTMPFSDLQFLHCDHFASCTAHVDKHFAGYHTLQWVETGSVELFYDNKRHLLAPGTWWTAFPGKRIRFHAAPGAKAWNHRYVAFTGSRVSQWIAEGLWFTHPQPCYLSDMATRWNGLLQAVKGAHTRFSHAHAVNRLEDLLIHLAQKREQGTIAASPTPAWLAPLLSEMTNPSFDAKHWACEQGMGVATLRRGFKEATGIPLHEHLLRSRLGLARDLLSETDLPTKEIATKLGYSDVYFFTRQFRRFVGIPPAAFRRSCQRNDCFVSAEK